MSCAYFEYAVHFCLSPLVLILCKLPWNNFCNDLQNVNSWDFAKWGIGGFSMIQGMQKGQPYCLPYLEQKLRDLKLSHQENTFLSSEFNTSQLIFFVRLVLLHSLNRAGAIDALFSEI